MKRKMDSRVAMGAYSDIRNYMGSATKKIAAMVNAAPRGKSDEPAMVGLSVASGSPLPSHI